MQLGYVGQTMVVRVTLAPFEPVEIEVPINCSFDSIFHRIDVRLRAQAHDKNYKGETIRHADLPVFWSKKDKATLFDPDERD